MTARAARYGWLHRWLRQGVDPVGRLLGGAGLLVLSLLMFLGFLRSDAVLAAPETVVALLLTVGLPAAGGAALLRGRAGGRRRLAERKALLRRRTLDAEILRLAGRSGGKLTVVELVRDLAITPDEAREALDGLHTREMAEIEITDSGGVVYAFRDIRQLGEKESARGLLDA